MNSTKQTTTTATLNKKNKKTLKMRNGKRLNKILMK